MNKLVSVVDIFIVITLLAMSDLTLINYSYSYLNFLFNASYHNRFVEPKVKIWRSCAR
jgi:hypothetical protein